MYSRQTFGIILAIFLCTSCCLSSENDTDVDYPAYSDEYYGDYDNEELTTSKNLLQSTSTSSTTTRSSILNDIDVLNPEPTCPELCECKDEFKTINCSNRNLLNVPNNLPDNVVRIDLSYNLISELNDDIFENCTNIKEIILTGNRISSLNSGIFANLKRLEHIGLAHNQLTDINPDTFSEAVSLLKLTLSHNSLTINSNGSFLNQPKLRELLLRNCSLTELYNETFANSTELIHLQLDHNNFGKKINTQAFEPLKNLVKLKLPEIEEDTIKELCNILSSIDVINLKSFDVSCFELASGSSFDESIITATAETMRPALRETEINKIATKITDNNQLDSHIPSGGRKRNGTRMSPSNSLITTFGTNMENGTDIDSTIPGNTSSVVSQVDDGKPYQVSVSSQTIHSVLIGIIIVAVVGIIIGVICRKDICGVKTKLCRTRRPPPTDQVRPAEEIPLNKV